jgi:TIR domain
MTKLFISHASEDKVEIAKPLAELLIKEGVEVWFDDYELKLGAPLRESIDAGLKAADYGIVILSKNFFSKQWTVYELDALITIEQTYAKKKVLPIWHKIEIEDIIAYSPNLANKIAAKSNLGIDKVVTDILNAIGWTKQAGVVPANLSAVHVPKDLLFDYQAVIGYLKEIKENTSYLWPAMAKVNDKGGTVREEIRLSTFTTIKDSLDSLLLLGLLVYQTKFAYEMITSKETVLTIHIENMTTQLRNMIRLIATEML